jgi:anti-sigma-K factor RskA
MTDTPLSRRDEDDMLAAEYVLGVPDLSERLAIEARLKTDAAFADLVEGWVQRLSPLNDAYPEAPAPDLLQKIEARLFPLAPQRARGTLWRWLAGGVVAASLVIAAVATLTPPQPVLVATLATQDLRLSYEVRSFGDSLQVTRVAGVPAVAGQVHELWVIAPGAAPVSLGLLQDRPLTVRYPSLPAGWTLAVSVEPAGGSPTGAPTGPVILSAVTAGDA